MSEFPTGPDIVVPSPLRSVPGHHRKGSSFVPAFPRSRGNVPGREGRKSFISWMFLRSRPHRSRCRPDTLEATDIKRSRVPGPSSYKERGASGMLPLHILIAAAGTATATAHRRPGFPQRNSLSQPATEILPMKSLTLTAYWRSRDVRPGEFQETFPVRFDVRRYEQNPWVPAKLHEPRRYDSEYAAQLALGRIRRIIEFMDTTGLQPSTDLDRLFPSGRGLPNYADHTQLWRDAERRLLLTTEPYYLPKRLSTPPGWRAVALPPGYGLWREALSHDVAQTEFIWLSPIVGGVDLEALAGKLMLVRFQRERSAPKAH